MFSKKNYKKVLVSILVLTMILGTVALAADGIYQKKLTATYGKVKFNYEGSDVTSQIESIYGTPAFVTEGRTYVPVRAIGDLVGVNIEYDDKEHTVKITDPKVTEHKLQLEDKDKEIAKLKAEIEKLEKSTKKEDKKEEVTKDDLKSLQSSLNKKYSEYENVEFDIVLKENNNKITIDINVNLKNTRDEQNWIRMRSSDKKYLIEDVVDQVEKEFKNVDITGNIYDSFSRKDLYTFRKNKNGSLSVSEGYDKYDKYDKYDRYDKYGRYSASLDLYVEDEFYEEYGISGVKLYESSYGSRYDAFEIYIPDTNTNITKWKSVTASNLDRTLDRITKEIEYEYNYNKDYSYITIDVKKGSITEGTYIKYYDDSYGVFKFK